MSQIAPEEWEYLDEEPEEPADEPLVPRYDRSLFNDLAPGFLLARMDWEDEGACRSVGPDAFFLEKAMNAHQAKAICAQCPVKRECLDHVMRIEGAYRHGIWGGTTPEERKALAREERALSKALLSD